MLSSITGSHAGCCTPWRCHYRVFNSSKLNTLRASLLGVPCTWFELFICVAVQDLEDERDLDDAVRDLHGQVMMGER